MGGLSPLFWFFLNNSKSTSLFYYTLIWNTNTKFGVKCSNQSPDSGQKPGSFLSVGINLFKINDGSTTVMCEICSKLTIKTPEQCQQ